LKPDCVLKKLIEIEQGNYHRVPPINTSIGKSKLVKEESA